MKKLFVVLFISVGFLSCEDDDNDIAPENSNIERDAEFPSDIPALYRSFYQENGGLNYAQVNGSRMSYVDNGVEDKPTIVLVHGLPDHNFLYRDVIAEIGDRYRVIAPDHIGYGLSDKPDLEYSFTTISEYLEGFIKTLGLTDIHLVLTDVGGPAGFGFAARNPELVSSITMYETLWLPVDDLENSNYAPPFQEFLLNVREPGIGEQIVVVDNQLLLFLDQLTVTDMPDEVFEVYSYPWLIEEDRTVLLENTRSIPVEGEPVDSKELFDNFAEYLQTSETPKLVIEAQPGAISPGYYVDQAVDLFPNTEKAIITEAGHFVTEDRPVEFTQRLLEFVEGLE